MVPWRAAKIREISKLGKAPSAASISSGNFSSRRALSIFRVAGELAIDALSEGKDKVFISGYRLL